MTQFYFDPDREGDPHALPDGEVFYIDDEKAIRWNTERAEQGTGYAAGWYWWACFAGCLPDSDPMGPFESESDAITDARESQGF